MNQEDFEEKIRKSKEIAINIVEEFQKKHIPYDIGIEALMMASVSSLYSAKCDPLYFISDLINLWLDYCRLANGEANHEN